VQAASPILVDDETLLEGRRVLAVEDGPTVTHGEMPYGAASIAARNLHATLVDPRAFAVGEIADTFQRYPGLGPLLPAMGYGDRQVHDLQRTLDRAALFGVEAVAIGTPIDLARLVRIALPHTRVRYELRLLGGVSLERLLEPVLAATPAMAAH
jgi:predicted GTPase